MKKYNNNSIFFGLYGDDCEYVTFIVEPDCLSGDRYGNLSVEGGHPDGEMCAVVQCLGCLRVALHQGAQAHAHVHQVAHQVSQRGNTASRHRRHGQHLSSGLSHFHQHVELEF